MEFKDKTIVCRDCGTEFIFTSGEQTFFKEKGIENEPKRCKACRDKKKAERNNYNANNQTDYQE